MSYKINEIEYKATLQLNADYRQHHFIQKALKGLEVFILKNTENKETLLLQDINPETNESSEILPIWCHENYAKAFANASEEYTNFEPQPIRLAAFLDEWLPQLSQTGMELAVFPLPNDESDCNIMTCDELLDAFNKA